MALPGSLRLVPLLQRYYEALRPPDSFFAALRFLRLAIPRSVCVSSPFGRRRQADGSSRSLLYRLLPIRLTSWNCQDLPCSRETLMTIRPALRPRRDRVRATGPRVNVLDTAPRTKAQRGLPTIANFGAQSHGFWFRCLRLEVEVTRHRARLASGCWSQLCRTGFDPQGFYERFLNWNSSSFPELHGASFVLALFYHRRLCLFNFTGYWPLTTGHCSRATDRHSPLATRHSPLATSSIFTGHCSPAVRQPSGVRSCAGPSPLATAIHRPPDWQRPNGARSRRSVPLYSVCHRTGRSLRTN